MKLIIALIRPEKLAEVDRAIAQPGVFLRYVGRAVDVRDSPPRLYRGHRTYDPRARVRLEVVVLNETLVQQTIGAIVRAASAADSWRQGSGHVLVVPLEDCDDLSAALLGRRPRRCDGRRVAPTRQRRVDRSGAA